MIPLLIVLCVFLYAWLLFLSLKVSDLTKTSQYNLEVFEKKFQDIEDAFTLERENNEHLLERIQELEKSHRL